MKKLKQILVGFGVVLANIGAACTQLFRPERCNGMCGSCGFACAQPLVGLVGIGLIAILVSKLKGKLDKSRTKTIPGTAKNGENKEHLLC